VLAEPPASVAPLAAAPAPIEERGLFEYDGEATDVTDVALVDFPVLTDAVELPGLAFAATAKTSAPARSTLSQPVATTSAAVRPAAAPAPATPRSASRIETAYAGSRPAPRPVDATAPASSATPAPPPQAAAAPPSVASAAKPAAAPRPADDDVLRQTQTLRAIAVAKSIDDISEMDAETLFSDAEFDLVAAALASAAEWPDEEPQAQATPTPLPAPTVTATAPAAPVPMTAPATPVPTTAAAPAKPPVSRAAAILADDPFDFLGLGEDAPLELIDDSAQPPNDRKTAAR
jgi:hypothetical protein